MNALEDCRLLPALYWEVGAGNRIADAVELAGYNRATALLMFGDIPAGTPEIYAEVSDDQDTWTEVGRWSVTDHQLDRVYAIELHNFPQAYAHVAVARNGLSFGVVGFYQLTEARQNPVPPDYSGADLVAKKYVVEYRGQA